MTQLHFIVVCFIVAAVVDASVALANFRFAKSYGDHMVLQAEPLQAVVWGYCKTGQAVQVSLDGAKPINAEIRPSLSPSASDESLWRVTLPITPPSLTTHTLTATDSFGSVISLTDVLFGDVFVCSGQSNMAFLVQNAFDGLQAVQEANDYPNIRLFTTSKVESAEPLEDLSKVELEWSQASNVSISQSNRGANDDNWLYFSATCWFTALHIFKARPAVPLGLVSSNWGGTSIEAWSSPAVLAQCNDTHLVANDITANPTHTTLYNAMLHPLFNMTIRSFLWYQGESNSGAPDMYACTFPAFIADLRQRWHIATDALTDPLFPFGFVQLAAQLDSNPLGFTGLRWAQTAEQGEVPNSKMPHVYMAVAYDLGDAASPYGSVHPRYKKDVGERLGNAALAELYGNIQAMRRPYVTHATAAPGGSITLTFSQRINIRNATIANWEVCPTTSLSLCMQSTDSSSGWLPAHITHATSITVTVALTLPPSTSTPLSALRFAWSVFPCPYKSCALYADSHDDAALPPAPFLWKL